MRDAVRLYTQGPDVFDRDTGQTVDGPQATLYEGKARVKAPAAAAEEVQAGDREVTLRQYEVSLPWATPLPAGGRVLPGARVQVISSHDARMVGVVLYVVAAPFSDQATAWRIITEDRS